jgi:RNA polymerase sigma factor (sigma-70 family)
MGISTTSLTPRVESDSSPSRTTTRKNKTVIRPTWITAPSLRPNTQFLAEGCIAGDPEAIAIRDAYRFHTSRATRITMMGRNDPALSRDTLIALDEIPFEGTLGPKELTGENSDFVPALLKAMAKENGSDIQEDECLVVANERAATDHEESERKSRQSAKTEKTGYVVSGKTVFLTPAEREKHFESLLDQSWAVYHPDPTNSRGHLLNTLETFALERCENAFKQLSMRLLDRHKDLAHDFVMHAIKQIEAEKYHAKGPFSHWIKKVFRRFADNELNNLTKERGKFVGLTDPNDEDDTAEVEQGYVSSESVAFEQYMRDERESELRSRIDSQLEWLPESDQAYAEFLKAGMNQNQAAAATGVSVVTARKYENRIRRALVGVVDLEACSDESNLLPWPEPNSFSIQACVEEAAFEPLLGVAEAAKLLCVHPKTVQALARAGSIPCIRFGKYWRFRTSSLDAWVRERLTSDHQSRRAS